MKYSQERKQAVLDKLQAPYNCTVKEEGISAATIYNWRKKAHKRGQLLPNVSGTPDGWSSLEKFNAVLETAALTEQELAEYCRRRGLYPEQIQRWRASCEQANARSGAGCSPNCNDQSGSQAPTRTRARIATQRCCLGRNCSASGFAKKSPGDLGGRGKMTNATDRRQILALVNEARRNGARLYRICQELGIGQNTYRRWSKGGQDQRPHTVRPKPAHALSASERQAVLDVCHRPAFASLPPAQIVARLLDDEQRYLASESRSVLLSVSHY